MKEELVDLSDEVWQRIHARVDGLTDEEYFFEPAPGCWSIRTRADGAVVADGTLPRPDPEPLTTIAWRLWHLIDMYGEDRAPRWLDLPPQGPPIGLDDPDGSPPATAAIAVDLLERAHSRWDAHLGLVTEARLAEPVGAVAGPQYADSTCAAYVLHMLDEFVHHGAEIALLRDLWRWQNTTVADEHYELEEPMPELMTALAQISPNQRLAVLLHDYADRPTSEIAETLGCSRATVHVHLSQGRRRLRALLETTDE